MTSMYIFIDFQSLMLLYDQIGRFLCDITSNEDKFVRSKHVSLLKIIGKFCGNQMYN